MPTLDRAIAAVQAGDADRTDAQVIRQAIWRRERRIGALVATVQDLAALLDHILRYDEFGRSALPPDLVRMIQSHRDTARAVAPTEG